MLIKKTYPNKTEWYLDGKLHRDDGPAIEYTDGDKHWYINGKRIFDNIYVFTLYDKVHLNIFEKVFNNTDKNEYLRIKDNTHFNFMLSNKIKILVDGICVGEVEKLIISKPTISSSKVYTIQKSHEFGIKIQHEVKIGQIWEHDRENFKVKVLLINDSHIELECIESNSRSMSIGDVYILDDDLLQSNYTLNKSTNGTAKCIGCGKDFPYAAYSPNFECWACKNGF